MNNYDNAISELRLWAKNEIVPGDLQDLCKVAASALEQHHWIPVGERLPETGEYQVVFKLYGKQYISPANYDADSCGWCTQLTVTHWKPIILPEGA